MLAGMEQVTLPLAERLAGPEPFGVGMYFAGALARELAAEAAEGGPKLNRLVSFLREHRLDPFTFNAFPQGGFHSETLKRDVFRPTWRERERLEYTLSVARVAAKLAEELNREGALSISTHTGMFGAEIKEHDDLYECALNFMHFARRMRRLEEEGGPRIILSLEAEPRANCGDTAALRAFLNDVYKWGSEWLASELQTDRQKCVRDLQRYLGACLDCCHSAVEFELADLALREATAAGGPLGKLQFSNALRLVDPMNNEVGRKTLFEMAEPRYLHQVTGAQDASDPMEARSRVEDLPELEALLASEESRANGLDAM